MIIVVKPSTNGDRYCYPCGGAQHSGRIEEAQASQDPRTTAAYCEFRSSPMLFGNNDEGLKAHIGIYITRALVASSNMASES